MRLFKVLFVILIALSLSIPALSYSPERTVDPEYSGPKVYRGYIVNTSPNRYLVVEILDADGTTLFAKQIAPNRPVKMPYQKWGEGYIPDLGNYHKLLEKYYEEHGMALWIHNILLPVGTYTIKYKWSDNIDWTVETVTFTQEMMDNAPGPFVLEFYE
jgi:hypothetical protein